MKLTVIGGGGVRSMFLAKSIAQKAAELHITELVFMDNDGEKNCGFTAVWPRMSPRMLNPELKFRLTTDAVDAVKDADYIITTIRVGGDHMRVREERIALANGVLGQETTGAAGLSFAMRSVPALAEYCELIRQYAKPTVKVFNFTNPPALSLRLCEIWAMTSPMGSAMPPAACCTNLRTSTVYLRIGS